MQLSYIGAEQQFDIIQIVVISWELVEYHVFFAQLAANLECVLCAQKQRAYLTREENVQVALFGGAQPVQTFFLAAQGVVYGQEHIAQSFVVSP